MVSSDLDQIDVVGDRHRQDTQRVTADQVLDEDGRLVAASQPDDLRRMPKEGGQVGEIRVQGHNAEPMLGRIAPDRPIISGVETKRADLAGLGKGTRQRQRKAMAQILVEQELQAGVIAVRRCRSAA